MARIRDTAPFLPYTFNLETYYNFNYNNYNRMSIKKDPFYAPTDTTVRPQKLLKDTPIYLLGHIYFYYKRQISFTFFSFNFANWLTKVISLISNFKVLVVELDR